MFEERVAEGMRAAQPYLSEPGQPDAAMIRMVTGGQTDPARPDASPRVEALKDFGYQMATEALAFAVPGVTGKVLERLANGKPDEFQATLDEIDAFIKQAPDRPLPRTMSPLVSHTPPPPPAAGAPPTTGEFRIAADGTAVVATPVPPPATTRKDTLEALATDEAMGVRFVEDGDGQDKRGKVGGESTFRTARPPSTARTARGVLSN